MRPTIVIRLPATIYRGQMAGAVFTATVSDPDGDAVTLDWAFSPGACPTDAKDLTTWGEGRRFESDTDTFAVSQTETLAAFCVRARATDPYGAAAIDAVTINPDDHAPVATIDVVAPVTATAADFPKHTMFKLSAAQSSDADPLDKSMLTYAWSLQIGQGASASVPACAGTTDDSQVCFTADMAGDYDVQLSVNDGVDTTVVHKILHVAPGPAPGAVLDVTDFIVDPTWLPQDSPFPLGSTIRLSSMRSSPTSSPPTPTFHVDFPDGSTMAPTDCPDGANALVKCFVADTPGHYTAHLDVTSDDGTDSTTQTFEVRTDQLPCIQTSTPATNGSALVLLASNPLTFQVDKTCDDLDPFPMAGVLTTPVNWLVSVNGGPMALRKVGFPTFSINETDYRVGDQVDVRVEITDRQGGQHLADCGDADTCQSAINYCSSATCYQRFTWQVSVR